MSKPDVITSGGDLLQMASGPTSVPWKPTNYTGEQLFRNDPKDVEAAQLSVLQERFEELTPKLAALRNLVEENRIEKLNNLDEIVPLLFPHTMYKSYPMSLITDARLVTSALPSAW